jgi:PGF-pre-PGF domain-containing protein/PGF-CTERM protein
MVEEYGRSVFVHRETGDNAVQTDSGIGKFHPLHATAAGKSILAFLPEERVNEICETQGLESFTDNTITDNDRGLDGEQVQNFSENTVTDTANESATFANSDGLDVANNFVQRNGVGLSFDSLDDVTVRDNVLDDNDVGISDYYSQNLTIVSNQFSNHPTQGVVLEFADGFEIRDNDFVQNQPDSMYGVAAGARLEISSGDSGTVIGNEFDDNDDALQVVAQDSSSNLLGTPIDVRHNNFTSNAVGLVVYDETDRLTIRDNSFEGSIETAVEYSVSNPANYLNATQNWWGNVTGPSGNESDPVTGTLADGDGDAVGANVMFDPWLGSVPDGGEDGGSGGGDDGSGGNDGDSDGSGAGDGGSGGGGTAPAPTPAPTPEPTVVLEETDGGVSVTVGGAQAGTPVVISLDGAAKTGELELATIAVTTTEAVDFVATVDVQAEPPEASEALPTDVTEIAYFEVDAELTDDQIEEGTFEFTMTTEALADRGLEPEDVVLYHSVDGEWVERGTTVVEEREDAVDFRAQAPHFSWFVVGGVQSTGSEPDDGESDGSDATGGDETGDDETEDDGTESEETAPEAEENKADQGSGSGDESDDGSPGFGLGAAVVALIGVALLAVRRRA